MIALVRFQLAGFVRSLRVLQPLLAVVLLLVLVLLNLPSVDTAELPQVDVDALRRKAIVGGYGDAAALMFPIWAWAARGLLDTEPDGQRELSLLATGSTLVPGLSGLLAAFTVNTGLAALVLAPILGHGLVNDVGTAPTLLAVALYLLAALAATLVGAWTSRAVISEQAVSILALLGGCALVLLLGLGPLAPLGVPMIGWLRAAHDGPQAFTDAFPGLAAHLLLWSAVTATAYLTVRLRRG